MSHSVSPVPLQFIDTHVHLNFDVFAPNLEEISQQWRDWGIVRLVHSCVTPSEFDAIQALSQRFQELYFAVGLHPLDAQDWTPALVNQIQALAASDPKVVAIGEMGLDLFKADNLTQQQQVLWSQLEIARALQLPVIIHCRDAAKPLLDLLQDFWQQQGSVAGVMHCWGGTPEETQWFLDLGFYVSFSGIVTFKKATQVQASARMVPGDRLLIETDCPFLTPVPQRGKHPNQPAYVRYVAEHMALLRGVPLAALAAETTHNACQLFGFPMPETSHAQAG